MGVSWPRVGYWVLTVVVVGLISIAFVVSWDSAEAWGSDRAAWVQTVGTLLALVIAIAAPIWERAVEKHSNLERDRVRSRSILIDLAPAFERLLEGLASAHRHDQVDYSHGVGMVLRSGENGRAGSMPARDVLSVVPERFIDRGRMLQLGDVPTSVALAIQDVVIHVGEARRVYKLLLDINVRSKNFEEAKKALEGARKSLSSAISSVEKAIEAIRTELGLGDAH